jgi:hypothetical protein
MMMLMMTGLQTLQTYRKRKRWFKPPIKLRSHFNRHGPCQASEFCLCSSCQCRSLAVA